jgi:hypothetical protein
MQLATEFRYEFKAAGCQRRRVLSEAHRQILVDHGSKTRFQAAKTDDRTPGIPESYPAAIRGL